MHETKPYLFVLSGYLLRLEQFRAIKQIID